jgi:hypothetical protein
MSLDPWTFEYNDLLLSEDSLICVSNIDGLDLPDIRTNDTNIPGHHGSFAGLDRLDARVFDLDIEVRGRTNNELFTNLHALAAATEPRDNEIPFKLRLDESQQTLRINCRPRRRNIPITRDHVFGRVECNLQFWASDPFIYSDQLNIGTTNAAAEDTGRAFDWEFDWDYGEGPDSVGEITAENTGSAPTFFVARVFGPAINPTIGGLDGFLRWDGTLNAGEFLEFNANAGRRTVMLGGTSTRFEFLSLDSTWFTLRPGPNPIRFTTEDGVGSMELQWRSAFWSAT